MVVYSLSLGPEVALSNLDYLSQKLLSFTIYKLKRTFISPIEAEENLARPAEAKEIVVRLAEPEVNVTKPTEAEEDVVRPVIAE